MTRLKCDLSISGIRELQKQIEKYQSSLTYKAQLLAERLSEIGVEVAKTHVLNYDAVFTSELLNSIHNEYVSSKKGGAIFAIMADSQHAIFVEFGTGSVGEEAGYPYPFPDGIDWQYNSGSTIVQLSTGEYGWFYPVDEAKTEWRFTQGMPSRPFMYETSLELQQRIVKVAKQIFKG